MSQYLNKYCQFQSDQYPDMLPDEIVLSFHDPATIEALYAFAELTEDDDLAVAIVRRLDAIAEEYVESNEAVEQINKQIARQNAEALVCGK
jgi:hypothetical protein